jgi:hypothetical protein
MTWKRHYPHVEEHEFESGKNFRQMDRIIMTNDGRISGRATWVRVAMYHDAFILFFWKTIL